jgi:hypothetical protein
MARLSLPGRRHLRGDETRYRATFTTDGQAWVDPESVGAAAAYDEWTGQQLDLDDASPPAGSTRDLPRSFSLAATMTTATSATGRLQHSRPRPSASSPATRQSQCLFRRPPEVKYGGT